VIWTADEIRQLRYRLGWSQAEMARCLKLELNTVSEWEAGMHLPLEQHRIALLSIMHQAESNVEKVQRRPIAEALMRDKGLSQIHDLDVIDGLEKSPFGTRGTSN
jgi:transcriptional regulator with XRE-family HTH domain